jgi:glyoxylase-like metal-dependent hydrolase (beta-lactamase superfamily II)
MSLMATLNSIGRAPGSEVSSSAMALPARDAREHLIQPHEGVSQVADDIWCISCPVPFDVGSVNVYLLVGDPVTLVDTGTKIAFTVDDLWELLKRTGTDPASIRQLVLTHRHIDHFGLGRAIQDRTGCEVISSTVDGPFIADWRGMAAGSRELFRRSGTAFGIPDDLFATNEKWARAIVMAADPVTSDRLVQEGDEVVAGGRRLRVIEAPGHTEGLITFLDEQTGVYLVNDHVLEHITPNPDIYSYDVDNLKSGLPDYINSLRKVRDLPVSLVLPGHGFEMTNLAGRVDEVLFHHQQRADKIAALVVDKPREIFEVVGLVWPKLRPQDSHLAVREIIGHMILLEAEGRVARDWDGDVLIYRAT